MKIIDTYSISDNSYKPVGIVRFKDKYGSIIAEKHNMVVNSGRELIYLIFRNFFNINDSSSNVTSGSLKLRLSYDNTSSQTTAALDINTVFKSEFEVHETSGNTSLFKEFDINNNESNVDANIIIPVFDDTDRIITFKAKISDSSIEGDYLKFNQIYLYYTYNDSSNNEEVSKLFSRVAMDPVFLVNGQEYNIEYSLYF